MNTRPFLLSRIVVFLLLASFLYTPILHATSVSYSPPVEKVKPPVKKKQKEKRLKKQQKSPNKTQNLLGALIIGTMVLAILNIVGAFLFGFGIYILPILFTGLVMMGISNLVGLILSILLVALPKKLSQGSVATISSGAIFIFLLVLFASDIIIGITFLIWGLIMLLPFAWILGLALLGIGLLIMLFFFLALRD